MLSKLSLVNFVAIIKLKQSVQSKNIIKTSSLEFSNKGILITISINAREPIERNIFDFKE
ncbi:MAG: hypothetical protein ACP6IY_17030 [Promethearchaeia archaeon]